MAASAPRDALAGFSRSRVIASVAAGRSEAEVEDLRLKVLAAAGQRKAEEFVTPDAVTAKYRCTVCGNANQAEFLYNNRDGDVVCMGADGEGCGNVVEDHHRHEGSQYRKFEGEEDQSHHGPPPNKLYSAAHNMRTMMVATSGAGGATASRLRQAYDAVELGLSNIGSDERRTRVGYKDRMKKRAFEIIAHAQMNLSMHPTVVARAQELFAAFRDEQEYVQRFDGVVAACLIQAAEEAAEEDARLKLREGQGAGAHTHHQTTSSSSSAPIVPEHQHHQPPPQTLPPPNHVSKRALLLSQPLAKKARTTAAATKRAGKDWTAKLGAI